MKDWYSVCLPVSDPFWSERLADLCAVDLEACQEARVHNSSTE